MRPAGRLGVPECGWTYPAPTSTNEHERLGASPHPRNQRTRLRVLNLARCVAVAERLCVFVKDVNSDTDKAALIADERRKELI